MEKQKLGSTPNEAPKKKKAYHEPQLSLISFTAEKGFANSAMMTTSIQNITYDASRDTDTWQ